jgi:thioredoxin reductase
LISANDRDGDKRMGSFDYDVLIIGSGFGGSVAALRAAEKGTGAVIDGPADQPLNAYEVRDADGSLKLRA